MGSSQPAKPRQTPVRFERVSEITALSLQPGDLSDITAIEHDCFSSPLTGEQIVSLLKDGHTRFFCIREMLPAAGPEPNPAGLPEEKPIVAYVWLQTVLDEGYIGNVAVCTRLRRQGLGDSLLEALDRFAAEQGLCFLTLEVRAGNAPAIALYEKHGYLRAGLRRNYYTAPREDAVLMTKEYA